MSEPTQIANALGDIIPKIGLTDEEWAEREDRVEEEKRRREQGADRAASENRRTVLAGRGLPSHALRALVGATETDAMRAARSFVSSPDALILVLAGPKGTGKTVAAAWVAVELGGTFLDVARLARLNRYAEEEIGPLERCKCLVLDDLGCEFSDVKGSFQATLDGLVNARYSQDRRTVITTNLGAADFKARYGERVSDRIRESGTFVALCGESLRCRR